VLMEDKNDAKKRGVKSPDRADSLALTFAYPTIEQDVITYIPRHGILDNVVGL
jgi:hypothetical protein